MDLSVLGRKGKNRQAQETRGKFRIDTPIFKRPRVAKVSVTGSWTQWYRPEGKVRGA